MLTTERSVQRSLHWVRPVMVMILIVTNLATVALAEAAPAAQDSQPSFPIRAAFYYPWFPQAWDQQGFDPFTNYTPTSGFYGSGLNMTKRHIAAMQYGGIDCYANPFSDQDQKGLRSVCQ